MPSTKSWWTGEIDWAAPAGHLLQKFLASLPKDRPFHLTLYRSAPLQLTVDRQLMSGDVDFFSDDDEDLSALVAAAGLDKAHGGFYLEPGFELSFRTSPRWRLRAKSVQRGNVTLTIPHPFDILIGKLDRLDAKDLLLRRWDRRQNLASDFSPMTRRNRGMIPWRSLTKSATTPAAKSTAKNVGYPTARAVNAFERTGQLTGHPTALELQRELQNAVDLFRPAFKEDSPNRYPENTRRLWREIFGADIDIQTEIIEPAMARRKQGYGEPPPDYKRALGQ